MENVLLFAVLMSILSACALGLRAWREARQEQLASELKIAALADDIFESDGQHAFTVGDRSASDARFGDLFTQATASSPVTRQSFLLLAIASLVIALAGSVIVSRALGTSPAAPASPTTAVATSDSAGSAAPAPGPPLEIVGLSHRQDAGNLTVYGILRNPSNGTPLGPLDVVVLLLRDDGGFISSGRVMIDSLSPGAVKPFAVGLPSSRGVGRYRVTLQTRDRVIPHVDRRS